MLTTAFSFSFFDFLLLLGKLLVLITEMYFFKINIMNLIRHHVRHDSRFVLRYMTFRMDKVKGQLISKANCQAVNFSKKRTNEFVFTTMQRVSVRFLEEIEVNSKTFRN